MADASAVGLAIKRRRQQVGLTQAELGKQLDVHSQTVSRYETGDIPVTLARLEEIARALRTASGDLLADAHRLLANEDAEIADIETAREAQWALTGEWTRSPARNQRARVETSDELAASFARRFGEGVVERRRALGLSQEALAARLGVDVAVVVGIESGEMQLSLERVAHIAHALRVNFVQFALTAGYSLDAAPQAENPAGVIFVARHLTSGEMAYIAYERPIPGPDPKLDAARRAVAGTNIPLIVVKDLREELMAARLRGDNLPLSVREFLAELRLRLTKGGAHDEEIDEAMDLLRSPQLFTFYKGGAPAEYSEDEVLRGMKAIAEGVIIPTLRERGRQIPPLEAPLEIEQIPASSFESMEREEGKKPKNKRA